MIGNSFEVLVIDDNESYAKIYASRIEKACKLKACYVVNPQDAESLLKSSPIKIIIFDQKMPVMTGTDLFVKLRHIDPFFKSILLTSEATPEQMAEALQLGFNELMIKDKDNHLLTFIVLNLLSKYHEERFAVKNRQPFHAEKIGGRLSKEYVRYSVATIHIVDNEYIAHDSWVVSDQIRAGESKEIVVEESVSVEDSISETLSNGINWGATIGLPDLSIANFTSSFSKEIKKSLKKEHSQSIKINQKKTWSMSLPADGNVAYERLEIAPIFQKARIFIETSFTWTTKTYVDSIELCLPTTAVKGRIFRCYKDSSSETLDLQTYRISE